jgi:hypothetical protein
LIREESKTLLVTRPVKKAGRKTELQDFWIILQLSEDGDVIERDRDIVARNAIASVVIGRNWTVMLAEIIHTMLLIDLDSVITT